MVNFFWFICNFHSSVHITTQLVCNYSVVYLAIMIICDLLELYAFSAADICFKKTPRTYRKSMNVHWLCVWKRFLRHCDDYKFLGINQKYDKDMYKRQFIRLGFEKYWPTFSICDRINKCGHAYRHIHSQSLFRRALDLNRKQTDNCYNEENCRDGKHEIITLTHFRFIYIALLLCHDYDNNRQRQRRSHIAK